MQHSAFSAGLACFAAAGSVLAAAPAHAETTSAFTLATGSVCQLSIPTIDTGVRPKATGFRNESSTTGNFVVCPIVVPNITFGGMKSLSIGLYSIDGVGRSVTCTAVNNFFGTEMQYSSKTLSVSTATHYQTLNWSSTDFGGEAGDTFLGMSITCQLPPQTAIDWVQISYPYEIGA